MLLSSVNQGRWVGGGIIDSRTTTEFVTDALVPRQNGQSMISPPFAACPTISVLNIS
jgi:hypothetical protein